jgi:hypothetical protein
VDIERFETGRSPFLSILVGAPPSGRWMTGEDEFLGEI